VDVLDACELGMKPGADLDQGADAAPHLHGAATRREDACDQLQEGRLTGTVLTDDAERLTGLDLEVDIAQCPELPLRGKLSPQDRLLQRPFFDDVQGEYPANAMGANPTLLDCAFGHLDLDREAAFEALDNTQTDRSNPRADEEEVHAQRRSRALALHEDAPAPFAVRRDW